MERWELEQLVPIRTVTYKESTKKSTIDLIFAKLLLSESLIYCKIAEDFDHNLDYQPILFKWILQIIDKPINSRRLLANTGQRFANKNFIKKSSQYIIFVIKND